MRNLKRALSLTLASVMLLGMMVVGSSAAGFPDVDEKDNVEAIEVLQAVAVMVGDKDTGNFRPDAPVSRAEMAVIMSNLLGLTTSYYVSTCPFTDVSGSYDWARGPVGACYATGVISGRTATAFDPSATVTAVEAAAMMMRALGYFKYTEDYAGGFNLAVVTQANKIDLFSGIEGDATSPLTRNQVAKLTLNALQANLVDFTGTPGIEVNGVKIGYKPEYTFRSGTDRKYFAISSQGNTTDGTTNQAYIQLGEQRYNGDLRLIDTAADDFDRPARHWEYNGKEIGIYAKNELLQAEYTTGISGKDLYNLLSAATIKEYEVTYYVDGKVDDTIKASNMIRTNDRTYDTTGKGVLTQVFVDNTKKEITIVSINTFLAKATADFNEKKGTLSVEVYAPNLNPTPKTIEAEEVPGIEGYKSGDYMLVNWAELGSGSSTNGKYEIVAVSTPETQSEVKITKYSEESYVVTGGTQYDYAKNGIYENELDQYATGSLKDHSYILYFDQYGYIAGVREFEGTKNYLFLAAYDGTGSHMGIKTFPGAAVFLDGTMDEIQIDVNETNKNLSKAGAGATGDEIDATNYPYLNKGDQQYNRWFTYTTTTKNNGTVYTLKPAVTWDSNANSGAGAATNYWVQQDAVATEDTINSGSVRVTATTVPTTPENKRAYGNDDSVYLTMEVGKVSANEPGAGHTMVGLTKVTGTYTGVQDVDLKVYNTTDNKLDATKPGIIAVFDKDLYIIGAVVVGEDNSSSDKYIYILDSAKNEWYDDESDCTYWEMDAVVDGVITTVTVKDEYGAMKTRVNAITGTDNPGKDCLVKVTYDKNGYITDIPTPITPADVNSDDRYSESDYTRDIEDGSATGNKEFKTYSVKYSKSNAGTKMPTTGDFYRTGKTLYNATAVKNSPADEDAGLTLSKDGKVIVVQNDRTVKGQEPKRVWDEFSDLQSAINWLADPDTFEGYVSAVLNDNGSAKYIVFNGIDELDTVDEVVDVRGVVVTETSEGLDVASREGLTAEQISEAVEQYMTKKGDEISNITYDVKTRTISITKIVNGREKVYVYPVTTSANLSAAAMAGAELINKVQGAIGSTSTTGAAVMVNGNKITTIPGTTKQDTADYVDNSGSDGTSNATKDLVGFLVSLKKSGATSIKIGADEYVWNDNVRYASKWIKVGASPNAGGDVTGAGNTLANKVESNITTQIGTITAGQTAEVSVTLIVDGTPIVVAIEAFSQS